jgi:hypothetical protein
MCADHVSKGGVGSLFGLAAKVGNAAVNLGFGDGSEFQFHCRVSSKRR